MAVMSGGRGRGEGSTEKPDSSCSDSAVVVRGNVISTLLRTAGDALHDLAPQHECEAPKRETPESRLAKYRAPVKDMIGRSPTDEGEIVDSMDSSVQFGTSLSRDPMPDANPALHPKLRTAQAM